MSRPVLTDVYNKLKEFGKVGKIRWYREDHVKLELTKLTIDNIKPNELHGIVFGLAFKVENDVSKFWIEIMNTDMVSITYDEDNENGQDIVIKMNDGSVISFWKDFFGTW